ncbi:MAG: RecQ family ATP-dependent DNA helicase [Bacteroidales bacterium]|jgi:ATP-dependent DNA helicase RecQ|nr:RecQ family ATP-dependent DNA helicase [Bacteroidales bacterium]
MGRENEILKKYWGYETFRPLQREIIESALEGKDTLALLPTGGGKSICFQIPALMVEGICLVVSPLIALMKDQVENLKKRGIKALQVHSGMTKDEIDYTLDNAIYGDYKFLYLSPERLQSEIVRVRIANMNVNFLVVDEAHCISHWGYDFRPDYLLIKDIRDIVGKVPVIALTATATPEVANDIMKQLNFSKPNLIKSGFERKNLSYVVREVEDKNGQLLKIVFSIQGSGIVYVRERKKADEISAFLNAQGISADSYHAGYGSEERAKKQERWMKGDTRIIVATNAFGMGIDKADVRFVCHFDLPESIESYFQEAGRAGRDEKKAYAVLLWNKHDIKRLNKIISISFPSFEYLTEVYQRLFNYIGYEFGTGKGDVIRFDIGDFAVKAKLHLVSAYHAIKYIESEGYWELTEEIETPSRIMFTVSRDELYKVQLKSTYLDSFIKILMRLYTSIFSTYVPIDEEYIARVSRNSKANVTANLITLSRMHVISYIPSVISPLLILKVERLENRGLLFSYENYKKRKANFEKRVKSMIDYASSKEQCRSEMLLEYFGEIGAEKCGICDVCLKRKDDFTKLSVKGDNTVEKLIRQQLSAKSLSMEEILLNFPEETDLIIDIMRDMIDRGIIKEVSGKYSVI